MNMRTHLEIWQQSGGYISGVKAIAKANPELSARQIINAMIEQNYMGGWSDVAITNAIESARRAA